jgi:hypothetical protein
MLFFALFSKHFQLQVMPQSPANRRSRDIRFQKIHRAMRLEVLGYKIMDCWQRILLQNRKFRQTIVQTYALEPHKLCYRSSRTGPSISGCFFHSGQV